MRSFIFIYELIIDDIHVIVFVAFDFEFEFYLLFSFTFLFLVIDDWLPS